MTRTSGRGCCAQLELGQIKQWKLTDFSEDSPPHENVLKGFKEWQSLELFLSPVLNPGSPLSNTSHSKSFSKAILTKMGFFHTGICKQFYNNFNQNLRILTQQHKTKHMWDSVATPCSPSPPNRFFTPSFVSLNARGNKILFHFLLSMKHGQKLKAPVPRHSIDAAQPWQGSYEGHKGRKASAKNAEH